MIMDISSKKRYGCCLLISVWSISYLLGLSYAKLLNETYSSTSVSTNICAYHNHAQRNNEEYSETIRCHGSNTCFAMVSVQSLTDGLSTVIRNQGCWKNDKALDCHRGECIIDSKDLAIGYTKQQFCCCTGRLCNHNLVHLSSNTVQATQIPEAATKFQPFGDKIGHQRNVRCSYYHKSNNGNHTVGTVLCQGSSKCFSAVVVRSNESSHLMSIESQGCWQDEKSIPCHRSACIIDSAIPSTKNKKQPQFCCCYGNLCNTNLTYADQLSVIPLEDSILHQMTQQDPPDDLHKNSIVLSAISSLFVISIFVFIGILVWRYASVKRQNRECAKHGHCNADGNFKYNRCPQLSMENLCYGDVIYHGKFSTVQEATMGRRNIIVKIFPEESHHLWLNEKEIYTILNCHPQIAKLLAASELHCDIGIQGMLVLENYSNGSLYNHLKNTTISWTESMHFMLSLANGVAFIHGEIDEYSCNGNERVIVAHRDITSQNVLIKDNGTCVLADFGIAVRIDGKEGLAMPKDGTVEYQSPEILTGAVNCHDCESSFKQADIYSMSMVLWEIASRCSDLYAGTTTPYHCLPYEHELRNAGFVCSPDTIRDIVVKQMKRPILPQCIENHTNGPAHKLLFDTIEECWDPEPEARLTALCVVRRLQQIEPTFKKCDTLSGVGKLSNEKSHLDVDASSIYCHSQSLITPDGKKDHNSHELPMFAHYHSRNNSPSQYRYSADPSPTNVADSLQTVSSSVVCLGSDPSHQSPHSSAGTAAKTVSLPGQLYSYSSTNSDVRFV